jgi:hypothetical protein
MRGTGRVPSELMLLDLLYAGLPVESSTRYVPPSKLHGVKRCNGAAHIGLAAQDARGPCHTAHRLDRGGETSRALSWLLALDLPCAAIPAMIATLAEALGLGAVVFSV